MNKQQLIESIILADTKGKSDFVNTVKSTLELSKFPCAKLELILNSIVAKNLTKI